MPMFIAVRFDNGKHVFPHFYMHTHAELAWCDSAVDLILPCVTYNARFHQIVFVVSVSFRITNLAFFDNRYIGEHLLEQAFDNKVSFWSSFPSFIAYLFRHRADGQKDSNKWM